VGERVRIYEVGPRDGLQNEATLVPTATKTRFIELLADAGLTEIEATSFVAPKAIPQLADADALFAGLPRRPGVRYPVLVPNLRGLERAEAAGADALAAVMSLNKPGFHITYGPGFVAAVGAKSKACKEKSDWSAVVLFFAGMSTKLASRRLAIAFALEFGYSHSKPRSVAPAPTGGPGVPATARLPVVTGGRCPRVDDGQRSRPGPDRPGSRLTAP
jgi:hypothetical protein